MDDGRQELKRVEAVYLALLRVSEATISKQAHAIRRPEPTVGHLPAGQDIYRLLLVLNGADDPQKRYRQSRRAATSGPTIDPLQQTHFLPVWVLSSLRIEI